MPGINLNIPYLMLLVLGLVTLLILALVVATISVKTLRAAGNRRHKARRARVEPLLESFLSSSGEGDVAELRKVGPRDRDRYLAPLMVERMELLRGADRERIASLARELGLIDRYLKDLSSRSRWRRARAAERLGYFGGPEEAPAIAALLGDEDETVRAVTGRALARIGSPEAVEALVRTLDNPSELTRLRIAENLDRVGQAAVPSLVALLEEAVGEDSLQHSHGPIFASQVLGGLRAYEARPALRLAARRSDEPDIRAQAVRALGKIGDVEDVPLLVEAAGDAAWPVRVQAANSLGVIGEPSTIPVLEKMVGDREWWARYASAGALVNMGRAGEDALIGLIDSPDPYTRDRAAATLERRGLTRRFVRQLPLDNARGERARNSISALVRHGITRHLSYLLSQMPQGDERNVLREMLGAGDASEPAATKPAAKPAGQPAPEPDTETATAPATRVSPEPATAPASDAPPVTEKVTPRTTTGAPVHTVAGTVAGGAGAGARSEAPEAATEEATNREEEPPMAPDGPEGGVSTGTRAERAARPAAETASGESADKKAEVAAVLRAGARGYLREMSGALAYGGGPGSVEGLFERGLEAVLSGERRLPSGLSPGHGPQETVAAIVRLGAEDQLDRLAPAEEDRSALAGLFAEGLSASLDSPNSPNGR